MNNELKPGDRVTSPSWDGHVATVEKIVPGPADIAIFTEGGYWRVSQLILVVEGGSHA